MRQLIVMCVLSLLTLPGASRAAETPSQPAPAGDVDYSLLPSERDKLSRLDVRHRQLIERTIRRCQQEGELRGEEDMRNNPCVVEGVDRELESLGDPQMTAFHHALPDEARLNHIRTEMEWQPAVKSRIAETEPLPWEPP